MADAMIQDEGAFVAGDISCRLGGTTRPAKDWQAAITAP